MFPEFQRNHNHGMQRSAKGNPNLNNLGRKTLSDVAIGGDFGCMITRADSFFNLIQEFGIIWIQGLPQFCYDKRYYVSCHQDNL
jgi:hypothetical protein